MTEAWAIDRDRLAAKGAELRTVREAAGLRLEDVVDRLGHPSRQFPVRTDKGTLSRIETGQLVPPPTLGLALSLWMQETRLQPSESNVVEITALGERNRRYDTPAAAQPAPVLSLFDHGLAPVPERTPKHDTIEASFEAFHAGNPWVYDALVALARDMKANGATIIGIGMLWEVLRWQHTRNTRDGHSDFALNNNYRALYARRIMDTEPNLAGIFHTRKRTTP